MKRSEKRTSAPISGMAETDNHQDTQHSQPSPKTEDTDMSEQVGPATNLSLDDPDKKSLYKFICLVHSTLRGIPYTGQVQQRRPFMSNPEILRSKPSKKLDDLLTVYHFP